MSEDFILMAQALDNASPNHFEVEGREVLVQEIDHRQRIVSQVSEVTKEGIKILDTSGISMTVDKQYFVIEVTTVQRDIAGRLAPVLCYGSYDKRDLTQLGDPLSKA